jgi:ABC-type uncharacterized transport system involved in gliding motility auxiliary subunit
MKLSTQLPMASPYRVAWNDVLKPFGVSVRSDMVYDLLANEVIPVPSSMGGLRILQRYPFFIRAQSTGQSVVNRDVGNVTLAWASSIDTTKSPAWSITPLLVSSRGSGASTGETMIAPTRDYPQTNLAPRLLAVQVTPKTADKAAAAHGRVIVVGNSEFATDRFAGEAPENLPFVLNAVDWLAQDESLIAIRSKNLRPPVLAFASESTREAVKYGNMVGVPVLVALAGLFHLMRRRRKTRERYHPAQTVLTGVAA